MEDAIELQAPFAAHTAMHYNIVTLEELEQAWEARKRISVRQNSEASVASIEDLIVSICLRPIPSPQLTPSKDVGLADRPREPTELETSEKMAKSPHYQFAGDPHNNGV